MSTSARTVGGWATAVATAAAFLPWASVSVAVGGVRFSGAASVRGIHVGSIAGLSYGWTMIVLAFVTAVAFSRSPSWLLLFAVLTGG